jgi:glycerol-3-phosphate acyltransferase PlsY
LIPCSTDEGKLVVVEFGLLVLAAYLMGSIPTAYLAAKLSRGIDIRQYGDANVGATNLLRLSSIGVSLPVIFFDIGKGLIIVLAAWLVGLDITQQVTVGLVAVIGHNWPVYLHFKGGRGALTTLGIAFILPLVNNSVPWGIVAFLLIAGVGIFIIHNLPVGLVAGIAALPLVSLGVGEPPSLTLGFLAMFLILVIRRLVAPRTSLTASMSRGQLLVNRLLFDRDIRDREAWIHHASREASKTQQQEKPGKG